MVNSTLKRYQAQLSQAQTLWVAFSGGVDSTVLLHALKHLFADLDIRAIHVNHHLQDQSDQWALHCQRVCDELSVSLVIENLSPGLDVGSTPSRGQALRGNLDTDPPVKPEDDMEKVRGSIEAWAREGRYHIFESLVGENDFLLMAHHTDDQAETVLLNLLRGAGTVGLAGMPIEREIGQGRLFRPFLNLSKEELLDYAQKHDLAWIEDPSNQSNQFRRNVIRNDIMPMMLEHWPDAVNKINQAAGHCREDAMLIQHWANALLPSPLAGEGPGVRVKKAGHRGPPLRHLSQFSVHEQNHLIRAWLKSRGQQYPSQQWLDELHHHVIQAKLDGQPVLKLGQGEVRRYQNHLYWLDQPDQKNQAYELKWQEGMTVPGYAEPLTQKALALQNCPVDQIHWDQVIVKNRLALKGDERYRPINAKHSKSLKNIFQENNIPPWARNHLPLLCIRHDVIWIVGLTEYQELDDASA